jgi:hypothetical protein
MEYEELYKFKRGDFIFEIFSEAGEMHIRYGIALKSYAYSRVVTTHLSPSGGIKFSRFG